MDIARWMMPMPPSRAIALAIRAPVTLSMFAETSGSSRRRCRDSRLSRETARRDKTTPAWGRNRKSSYVRPTKSLSRERLIAVLWLEPRYARLQAPSTPVAVLLDQPVDDLRLGQGRQVAQSLVLRRGDLAQDPPHD